jgi:hypothetical protein
MFLSLNVYLLCTWIKQNAFKKGFSLIYFGKSKYIFAHPHTAHTYIYIYDLFREKQDKLLSSHYIISISFEIKMSEKATRENSMNGIHIDELNDQTYKGKSS